MQMRDHFWAGGVSAALGLALALGVGCDSMAQDHDRVQAGDPGPSPAMIRAAVVRALPLLVKAGAEEYPKHRDCFSCHNQAVPVVALSLARQRGFAVEAQTLQAIAEHTESDLGTAIEEYRQGKGQPGSVIRAGYALWALEAAGWAPDQTTAAVAHYLLAAPGRLNHWSTQANRPPSEASDFTATALALRGLRAFGPPADSTGKKPPVGPVPGASKARSSDPASRRAEALKWLRQSRPRETEDRVFRLWGLTLAGADSQEVETAVADLLQTQRSDGGWSQLDSPARPAPVQDHKGGNRPDAAAGVGALTSDAYATGSVLVALHLAGGVPTDRPAYRRGLAYLVRTQTHDGSWRVTSRSRPFQTYFESGFPHGPNQFISAAASGWAVAALALACPMP
jgi:hypothetical protein